MDDDALRRGKPTCHVAFGEAIALLAGDALQALAFGVLAASRMPAPAGACSLLARAAGASGMAGGQGRRSRRDRHAADAGRAHRMHRMKTGALIAAAVQLGARCGGPLSASQDTALDRSPSAAGLAFQVVDDCSMSKVRRQRWARLRARTRRRTSRLTSRCWAWRRPGASACALRRGAHRARPLRRRGPPPARARRLDRRARALTKR